MIKLLVQIDCVTKTMHVAPVDGKRVLADSSKSVLERILGMSST
jgi:hypothetical protein